MIFKLIFPNTYPIDPPELFQILNIKHNNTNNYIGNNINNLIYMNQSGEKYLKYDLDILNRINWTTYITLGSIIYSLELKIYSQFKSKPLIKLDILHVYNDFKKLEIGNGKDSQIIYKMKEESNSYFNGKTPNNLINKSLKFYYPRKYKDIDVDIDVNNIPLYNNDFSYKSYKN